MGFDGHERTCYYGPMGNPCHLTLAAPRPAAPKAPSQFRSKAAILPHFNSTAFQTTPQVSGAQIANGTNGAEWNTFSAWQALPDRPAIPNPSPLVVSRGPEFPPRRGSAIMASKAVRLAQATLIRWWIWGLLTGADSRAYNCGVWRKCETSNRRQPGLRPSSRRIDPRGALPR